MRPSFSIMTLLVGFAPLLVSGSALGADQWPQWRGPDRTGQVKTGAWPDSLSDEHLEIKWQTPLGQSYSGPIVDSQRVYVTETRGREREVVRALDRTTGEEVWTREWEGALEVPFFAKANGDWIRSTPTTDGERIYVAGMRDVLVCLDCKSGEELWRFDFPQETRSPLPDFGFVSSPLLRGNFIYVQAGAGFCKLDKRTGTLVWNVLKDGGGMYGSAFSSPYVWQNSETGSARILVQTRNRLAAVDPDSGKVDWQQEIPAFRGMNILTPTVFEHSVLVSSYGGSTQLLQMPIDSGSVSPLWKNKVEGYMSSPVVIDGHAYLHLKNQRLTCIDLKTGESRWTTQPFGKYWSLVTNGEKILALDQRGDLYLLKANPEKFERLDERHVSDDETWAHLAVCGDEIFVRSLTGLTVYRWK